jgi:uncharacterized membrane protein YgcG
MFKQTGVNMKRFATFFVGLVIAVSAMAEASFDQIQTLIQQQQYSAAAAGLEGIIANHPKSAKAFYAMAQAQAGLGNLEKARKALDIATGLNPTLDFAPASSVQSLKDAITPQVSKIEVIEESHFWRNTIMALILAGAGIWVFMMYMRKLEEEAMARAKEDEAALKRAEEWAERQEARRQAEEAQAAKEIAEYNAKQAAEAALKAHKNYGHERFDPANPDKLKTVAQFKKEQSEAAEKQRLFLEAQERRAAQARADAAEASARMYRTAAQAVQPTQTVVHTNSGSNDMLTGVLIGNMLSDHGHHDTERTVIRETVREVPAPRSSWDDIGNDTPKSSSRSSSWDDDSSSRSSSKSSSWDSGSSSSSSWSSSSSDSSSSWSSSDSGSSSSWD